MLSVFAAIATGTACGVFNGYLITRHRIAPFIVTLGMMVIARGTALIFAKGAAIAPLGDTFNILGQEYLSPALSWVVLLGAGLIAGVAIFKASRGTARVVSLAGLGLVLSAAVYVFQGYSGVPIPVLLFAIFAAIGSVILNKTKLGRFILAIGGNAEAAWLAGVPIKKITLGTYVVLGALAGLSGAILSARLNGALPTAGELFELDAIAAVVIGGTSLLGGVGTVRGSILGAFFIGALNNGMSLLDVTEFYQKVIKGVIIIVAVWLDQSKRK